VAFIDEDLTKAGASLGGNVEKTKFLLSLDELLELEPGTVKGSEPLDSFENWNSLGIISFMALVDDQFGVNLQARQIAECNTIADLVALLGDGITQEIHG
jgi:acyl carrier protein